mgnify:FL=1
MKHFQSNNTNTNSYSKLRERSYGKNENNLKSPSIHLNEIINEPQKQTQIINSEENDIINENVKENSGIAINNNSNANFNENNWFN